MKSPLFNGGVLMVLLIFAFAMIFGANAPPPASAAPTPAADAAAPATNPASARRPLRDVDPAVAAFLKPVEAAAGDDDLRQEQKERYNTAIKLLESRITAYRAGLADMPAILEVAREVADARRDLAQSAEERLAIARQIVDALKAAEKRIEEPYKSGLGSEVNVLRARLARETAEVELLKLERSSATKPATQPQP